MSRPTVSIEDVECVGETDAAIQVVIGERKLWIPKSVIHDDSEVFDVDEHDKGTLVIYEWFSEKEGIE